MRLVFLRRHDFGRDRYYPMNTASRAILDLTGRKCLKDTEIERLKLAGFEVAVQDSGDNGATVQGEQS